MPTINPNEITNKVKIGEGVYGSVFKALWKSEGKEHVVAVKSVKASDDKTKEVAMNEITVLSCLRHPNIVTLHGYYIDDGYCYLVMEYCGVKLQDYLKSHNSLHEKRDILLAIGEGLCYAEKQHIVHHDLKVLLCLLNDR